MATVLGLAHVGIYVYDVERSKKFYTDILGMECIEQCTFTMDGETFTCAFMKRGSVCLELVQRGCYCNPGDGITDHVAYSVDDLDSIIEQLTTRGIRFEKNEPDFCAAMFAPGTRWIFFRGPDNEHIELAELPKEAR